jgi:HAD superfamily hydrolase (TIGR01509 family)
MRCIVLDGMGVIFAAADDVVELLVPFVRATGGDPALVEPAYKDASLGIIDADEFWVRVGLNASVEREYLSAHSLLPGAREFLVRANQAGVPVWCLSNDVARWSQHLRESLGIAALLRGVVISSDVRVRKPDAAIYRHLLGRTGCSPSDLLFVDDRRNNVEAAAALGIPSVRFADGYGYEQLATAVFGATS